MSPRVARLAVRLSGVLLCALLACTRAPSVHAPQSPQAPSSPAIQNTPGLFLYEVRGQQGSSFLLGTVHMGFGFDEVLTPYARKAFDTATRVMTEADVSGADPSEMLQAAMLPEDKSLKTIVGEQTWNKLVARLGSAVPAQLLERLEPWMPTVLLSLEELGAELQKRKPGSETRQMDVELMNEARERGKPLSHFETVQEQLAVFSSVDEKEQVHELERMLSEQSAQQSRELLNSFAAGDEVGLARVLFDPEELKRAPRFYERMLFDRNARWLPVIVGEVERGGVFIAVGAGHLLGERGIVALLRERGYAVERVMP